MAGGDRDYLRSFVQRRRADYHLTGLEVLDRHGAPLAASYDPQLRGAPELPRPAPGGTATPTEAVLHQKLGKQELLSFLTPVADAAGEIQGYLLVRQTIPETHLLRVAAAERSLQELRQRLLQFSPLKVSHYLGLIIVTLIAMMAAIWLGFYMARELTTPIRELAEGALKVAGGDYDFQIHQEGRDEIGFLVQSFNKMTQDLQQGRAQLAAAYRQLSVSHELISTQKRDMEILLKNVAAGVIALDAAGKVTMINDSAAQMLRLKREEVLGREARVLLPPAEYHRMVEVVAAARAAARGTVEKPLHLILPNQTLYLLLKTTVLKDEAGRDLGVVIVFEDLTELERAQRLAAWREVARRIAHEVKNPLTPLKLAAQRLQRRYADRLGEDGLVFQECTQIIVNQVEELQNLVNNFARFARLPQLTLAPQDFNALVQETVILYREFQPRVALEFHPDPQLPPVLLDREQVKRLLLNLLDNALASIDGAGTIMVSIRRTRPTAGWNSAWPTPAGASRTVTRCGSLSPTSPLSGAAPVWAWPSSIPSWPSTRAISGWKTMSPGGPNSSSTFPCTGPIMPGTLLVVDDEPQILRAVAGVLQDEGFEVLTAPDGETALKMVAAEAPDLVLLDIALPGLDGLEALTELKRQHPLLPVIMVSAYGSVENAVKATRLGAFDFIEKPPNADKILLSVRNALEWARLAEENRRLRQQRAPVKEIIGESAAIRRLREKLALVAPTNAAVLITGENGTGKEVVARALHALSRRCAPAPGGGELRRHPRRPHRKRALRPRKGGLHRGLQPAPGQVRPGP